MSTALVLDASAIVSLLADGGPAGEWVTATVEDAFLIAPSLAVLETANILRRQQLAGRLEPVEASLLHSELLALPLQLWPYDAVAGRAWELRQTLTAYDASYVALAELLGADVVTLDHRLALASGPRCTIRTPPLRQ